MLNKRVFSDLLNKLLFFWERFLKKRRPPWLRYTVAIGLVTLTLSISFLIQTHTHIHIYSISLLGAILATVYGGVGPGLIATLIASLGIDYLILDPIGKVLDGPESFLLLFFFTFICLATTFIVASLRLAYGNESLSKKRAEKETRARENILAIVSHDLKNPLASISLNTQLLMRQNLPENQQVWKELQTIRSATQHMNRLIQDLTDSAKVDLDRFTIDEEEHELIPIIQKAHEEFRLAALDRKIDLICAIDPLLGGAVISCDPNRILQVLSNLIGNAMKFTPKGGTVTIGASRNGMEAKIIVSDTGPGIAEDNQPRIFDRFWQAKENASKGTGLGLFIAKAITEAHHGRIEVQSKSGQGAHFSVTLPVKRFTEVVPDRHGLTMENFKRNSSENSPHAS